VNLVANYSFAAAEKKEVSLQTRSLLGLHMAVLLYSKLTQPLGLTKHKYPILAMLTGKDVDMEKRTSFYAASSSAMNNRGSIVDDSLWRHSQKC
jgi:hypothetical protein